METTIRNIGPDDLFAVVTLIREFATFEGLSHLCEVTEERLSAALFADDAVVEGLIALDDVHNVGYALFYPSFSSFRGQRGFYLDDIYVTEKYRGTGLGRAMLKKIARLAVERGFERIDFLVLDWNTEAAEFYLSLGAVRDDEERHLKFIDDAFRGLAK